MGRLADVAPSRFINCLTGGARAAMDFLAYADAGPERLPADRANLAVARPCAATTIGLVIFTAEGLIRARVRERQKGITDVVSVVHHAWLRWLSLHGIKTKAIPEMDGWLWREFPTDLVRIPIYNPICRSLLASSRFGSTELAIGGPELPVAFVAPVGLYAAGRPEVAMSLAARLTALLTTNRSTQYSAGQFAAQIAEIAHKAPVELAQQNHPLTPSTIDRDIRLQLLAGAASEAWAIPLFDGGLNTLAAQLGSDLWRSIDWTSDLSLISAYPGH